MIVDLHCHSIYSDGTLTPADVVARAHRNHVNVLALTDHDVTAGIDEARQAAVDYGIRLVNGVEVSVSWREQVIHIVGVNIDPEYPELIKGLDGLRCQRLERAEKIAGKLEQQGLSDVFSKVAQLAGTDAVTRTHFARFLIAQGLAKDMRQAFKRWLGKGKCAYVSAQWVSLVDAVDWIVGAGGQAIVAHPARYGLSKNKLKQLLQEFKQAGGTGMEVVSGCSTREVRQNMALLCQSYGLMASVGSDFHDPGQYGNDLGKGLDLPLNCTPIWHDWR